MNFLRNVMKTNNSNNTTRQEFSEASSFMETESSDAGDYASSSSAVSGAAYTRRAHHAGSWYSADANELDYELTKFLGDAEDDDGKDDTILASSSNATNSVAPGGIPNACISPHAGFRYSGPTAAYSYLALKEAILRNSSLRTIIVVRP